jgi:hypothetical protein
LIPSAELVRAIHGALRLARFDPQGFNFFNRTLEGFWRSFFAAVLVGPMQLLLTFEVASTSDGTARLGDGWLLGLLAFVVHWLAFPVVMLSVVDWLDRRHRYFVFMVALNWSNVVQVLLLLFVYSPVVSGLLPPEVTRLVGAGAVAFILVYEWFGFAIFAVASLGQG